MVFQEIHSYVIIVDIRFGFNIIYIMKIRDNKKGK